MKEPRIAYLAIVHGPTGDPLEWTAARTVKNAQANLTHWCVPWEFAARQGYSVRWRAEHVAGR